MAIFFGLGSNEGNRNANLQHAVEQLKSNGFEISAISPIVETPALLPKDAEPSWNKPFLNCVISGQARWQPSQGLEIVKQIEARLGRRVAEAKTAAMTGAQARAKTQAKKWSPRTIDIDLLIWHDQIVDSRKLTLPHYAITERAFVLTPLLHLQPDLVIPGQNQTVFDLCRTVKPAPLWMGILNITPDSFSDGGQIPVPDSICTSAVLGGRAGDGGDEALLARIDAMLDENVQIIDVGAESTGPNAAAVDADEEWRRLQPVLNLINQRLRGRCIRPMISIDSRHAATLEKALNHGADMINDVTGLRDPAIREIAKVSGCQVVAMHSLSIPADAKIVLPAGDTAVNQLRDWLHRNIDRWLDDGLDLNQIIFDPGIGFGKNSLQSFELLQHCNELKDAGLRLLIGHSRKSFMSGFTDRQFGQRDLETLGISLALCQQGVEIIRVHDPVMHIRAYRGWSHVARMD
ncbi:dihydropteroate synthase [Candidatus Spongiihabitans sp.]|uniref:dihydropteroate synthase n=1 Tax=Candidatus Spongiihabitans sp. TaxID=3101308 RepID=UPI003C7B76D8